MQKQRRSVPLLKQGDDKRLLPSSSSSIHSSKRAKKTNQRTQRNRPDQVGFSAPKSAATISSTTFIPASSPRFASAGSSPTTAWSRASLV